MQRRHRRCIVPQSSALCHSPVHCATVQCIVPQSGALCHSPVHCATVRCIVTQSSALCHSPVLLTMGEIIARNMLSWLKVLINYYCCIRLAVCIIVSAMHGHTNIKQKFTKILKNRFSPTLRHIQSDRRMEGLRLHIENSLVTSLSTPNRAHDAVYHRGTNRSRDSSAGIATGYGLDGPGIESREEEIFRTCTTRPWGSQRVPGLSRG